MEETQTIFWKIEDELDVRNRMCEMWFVIIVLNKFDIERAIMKENFARLTLSCSSPLLQSP